MGDLLSLALLGGLLALDVTSLGQFMVSRPLVAGALTGWMLGDAALGFEIGMILEIYLLVAFPVGGAHFPEGSTATVVAVATAAVAAPLGVSEAGGLALGTAAGLVWGQLGGATTTALRDLNMRLAPDPAAGLVTPARVWWGQLAAMATDFLRGAAVTASGVVAGRWLLERLGPAWPLTTEDTLGLVLVGGAVSMGILLRSFGGFRRRRVVFSTGLVVGVAVAWLL